MCKDSFRTISVAPALLFTYSPALLPHSLSHFSSFMNRVMAESNEL